MMTTRVLSCRVTGDRFVPGEWSVEKMDKDGGYEPVMFFRGPKAREQAIAHARDRFGQFDEITLNPYWPSAPTK
jgi:hypothetical protein